MPHEPSMGDPAELASLYVSGWLDPSERERFESHLDAGCATCQRELFETLQVALRLAEAVPAVAPAQGTRDALLQRIAGAEQQAGDARTAKPSPLQPQLATEPESEPVERAAPSKRPKERSPRPVTRRAADAHWKPTAVEGVEIRVLHIDRANDSFSALVRMRAGASYPQHRHRGPEHCLVLKGTLRVGNEVLRVGDYHMAPAGSHHGVQETDDGCVLFITSSLSDEFV